MAIKSPTMSLKDRISSPLASPLWNQLRTEAPGNITPTRHSFASSAFSTLKQFIRSSVATESPIRERIVHIVDNHHDNSRPSPALSDVSASTALTSDSLFSHRGQWPANDSEPATPFTPFTVASSMSATETGSTLSKLGLHAGSLSPRDERVRSMTIEKQARKVSIGFFPPMHGRAYGEGEVEDGVSDKDGVGSGEDSPRMVMASSGREEEGGGFPDWLRGDEVEEKGEMDAIEEWYRQVQLQPVEGPGDEPVSPLADTATTPRATPVSTPTMTRFPEKARVLAGEPVSPLAESALTPRATPVSTPTMARFPARGEEGGTAVEARELNTTPKATPKPVQDLVGAERVASWFMRTTPSPPKGVKTADRIVEETAEARLSSTTPKPTLTPLQTEEPRHPKTTPKPTLLCIIPKPIRATIQHTRTITDPYVPQPEEQQQSSTPLPPTQPPALAPEPKQHRPLPTQQPPISPQSTSTPLSAISHHTPTPLSAITPKLSPVPHPRNRSPLVGRERSPILRVQTNFDAPSPHSNSPQPVSALSLASSTNTSNSSRGPDTPILFLPGTPDTEPDEEGLTARPQQPTWWDGMGMGLSIDEVMRSPVTAVEMMGGLLFPSNSKGSGNGGSLPLTPLPFAMSPVTPISAVRKQQQPFGPLTPLSLSLPGAGAGVSMARFEVNTPRHQVPVTPRYYGGGGMWQGGGGGMLSPQQPTSALWRGPMTPNGYDDISPITRGEWGFLMGGGAGGVGRQAGVGRVDVEGDVGR